jgi:hypothetical protein
MARQAQDSFTVEIDGGPVGVSRGDILPEGDRVLVHLDEVAPGNQLFKQLVEDEPAPPVAAKSARTTKAAR